MIPDRIAPISFERPPADHGCAGQWRPFKATFNALCHTCQRFGKGGPQIDPAARIVHGGSICLNLVPVDGAHETNLAPAQPDAVCLTVGGTSEGRNSPPSAFRNAGVTGGVL